MFEDLTRTDDHHQPMSNDQINSLLDPKGKTVADGTFSLVATLEGRILHDDFIIGERVEPGRELMVIADESVFNDCSPQSDSGD